MRIFGGFILADKSGRKIMRNDLYDFRVEVLRLFTIRYIPVDRVLGWICCYEASSVETYTNWTRRYFGDDPRHMWYN
jgi:hypothetical protein